MFKLSYSHVIEEVRGDLNKTADYYGLPRDQIEPRHWAKVDAIKGARSLDEAQYLGKKAVQALMMTCLKLWAEHKIRGPHSPENLNKKAKEAEGLAKFQEKLGNDRAAEKQRQRAEKLRKEASVLMEERSAKGASEGVRRVHPKHPRKAVPGVGEVPAGRPGRRPARPRAADSRPRVRAPRKGA